MFPPLPTLTKEKFLSPHKNHLKNLKPFLAN